MKHKNFPVHRRDGRPAADRGNAGVHCRTASARSGQGAFHPLNTGWYQLTDGVRREIALPVTLPAELGRRLPWHNDTLTARDAGKR